jgi:hypothetical protein
MNESKVRTGFTSVPDKMVAFSKQNRNYTYVDFGNILEKVIKFSVSQRVTKI